MTPEAFVKEFIASLTPGVIPRDQFIDWRKIADKCKIHEDFIAYFDGLVPGNRASLQREIRDSLLSADEPFSLIKGAFEMLGHTNNYYVSDKDNLNFEEASESIAGGSQEDAATVAAVLLDLGLERLIGKDHDARSTFLGVQVGLESNRRKSVGGEVFNQWVRNLLESTCALLGPDCEVKHEVKIQYRNSPTGKRVDFAILHKGKVRIGVEVNFYTTSGSKPSEIKRAYENVNRSLHDVGVELVWITDGAGYLRMKKSLEEAFRAHRNTYNFVMAQHHLKDDILKYLRK